MRQSQFSMEILGQFSAEINMQHLRDRIAMHAEALRRFSPAQPVNHHRAPYPGIEFHCEHPSGPSMPIESREAA
jgi:hypothetical protein